MAEEGRERGKGRIRRGRAEDAERGRAGDRGKGETRGEGEGIGSALPTYHYVVI